MVSRDTRRQITIHDVYMYIPLYSWLSAIGTLSKLHSVDYKAIGLEGYGKDAGFYARQMRSLRKVSEAQGAVVDQVTGKPVGPIPRLNEMFDWFSRNQVKDQATIVHGDFKIDNLVSYISI
jgi:aminoglycoside phosphotransferase (APT) family kinase protein